jgi:hypothetical protein
LRSNFGGSWLDGPGQRRCARGFLPLWCWKGISEAVRRASSRVGLRCGMKMGWLLGRKRRDSKAEITERTRNAEGSQETQLPEPVSEQLREWQRLVSLWDRMEDPRLFMHEAPSAFEISSPNREGWVLHRKSAGVLWEWRRQWAVHASSCHLDLIWLFLSC